VETGRVGDRNTNKEKADWLAQTEKHKDKEAERKKDKKKKKRDGQIS
jgi:hypothetical protein